LEINTKRKAGIVFHTVPQVPWQYPVITERAAFDSLYKNPGDLEVNYFAFPWATIIDRYPSEFPLQRAAGLKTDATAFTKCQRIVFKLVRQLIQKVDNSISEAPLPEFSLQGLPSVEKEEVVITVCQHISYRSLRQLMKKIGINVCFSSHATNDDIEYFKASGIRLCPFPLFPVNVPAPGINKDLLYSFVGMECRSDNLSNVRDRIFAMNHPQDTYIKKRTGWHFDNRVYKEQVQNTPITDSEDKIEHDNAREFSQILARSRYSLCPSGTGPNNIRFWESLGAGSIPVLLSDQLLLPEYDWQNCILRVQEKDLGLLPDILGNITHEREVEMRRNCLNAFKEFTGDNISSPIRKYLLNL
jgi:hypothetical protein